MSTPSDLFPLGAFDHNVTKQNRSGHRDATAILVAYRHGLRASELVALRWDDIDLATGRLHVRRAKSGDASVHPIGAGKPRAAQAPARSPNVPIRLHLGASRTVVRSRISAHGLPGRSIPKRKGTGTMAGPPKIRLAFGNNRRRRSFALAVRCSRGLCRGRDAKESHRHCRQ